MLGKLIKNEFVQRGKTVCGIYLLVLVASIVENLMYLANEKISNDIIENLYTITNIVFLLVFFGGVAMVVLVSFQDYNKRLFKDQGYLTHTLPVKSSTMLFARGVCDLVVCLSMVVVFPVCLSIAISNFDMLKEILNLINEVFLQMSNKEIRRAVIALLILMFFLLLYGIWLYYFAYAAGHSFNKNKKLMSVLIYIGSFVVSELLASVLLSYIEKIDSIDDVTSVAIGGLIFAVYTAICFASTSNICKKHLNLE